MHFIKGTDRERADGIVRCRYDFLRRKMKRQTDALIGLRTKYPRCASRVLGIDAASNEVGCRPEVFASAFRRLRNHVRIFENGLGEKLNVPQLRITYHVGENFLDILDGLRAIEEAVNFLNLSSGDRLGHALALGEDVTEWYASKNNRIWIPQQDYLDNIVWLYNRLIDYKIPGMDSFKGYLEKKYETYFQKIYARNMDDAFMEQALEHARQYYTDIGAPMISFNGRCRFEIYQYYNAWKLRGDDPMLYERGFYRKEMLRSPEAESRVNKVFPKEKQYHYQPDVFLLNYYYQYNENVRREGRKMIEVKIRPDYIRAVQLIQKQMQYTIARRGIAIETNPSSNYLIGTFKDYEKHPIFCFYNKQFEQDPQRAAESPQLSVSINTDDMGVFSTSLENEYAILASALENAMDEEGNYRYNKSLVYDWVDDVRRMGNDQSFKLPEGEYRKLIGVKRK